jgi:hypothetical protein
MTERPNDAPDGDLEPSEVETSDLEPAPEEALAAESAREEEVAVEAAPAADAAPESSAELAEEASDLTDAELTAATEDAQAEVDEGKDAALEGNAAEGPEADQTEAEAEAEADAELEAEEEDAEVEEATEAAVAAPAARPGARARAEQARARATESHAVKAPRSTRTPFAIDPALRIKDPTSVVFVAGTILVFALVFLNAMAFGHGGAFRATHPPVTPGPTVSAAPSGSPGASGSAAPSGSPAASPAVTSPASLVPATTP